MDEYKIPIGRLGEQAIEFIQSNLKPLFTAFEVSAELSVEGFHLLFLGVAAVGLDRDRGGGGVAAERYRHGRLRGRLAAPDREPGPVGAHHADRQPRADLDDLLARGGVAARNPDGRVPRRSRLVVEPMLDLLITIPRFVILIPAVVLLGHRRRARRLRHHDTRRRAPHPHRRRRDPAGGRARGRGGACVRGQPPPGPVQGEAAAGAPVAGARDQPVPADVAGHGGHRGADRRRRSGRDNPGTPSCF